MTLALARATPDELRDQLRERLASDPAWFLEPLLLESVAAQLRAPWVVALDRDRGRALKALVYSAAERALKPIGPSRFVESELDKLSEAVRALVFGAQALEALVIDTSTGVPALEARTADPSLPRAEGFLRKKGGEAFEKLALKARLPGRFQAPLPLALSTDGSWDVEYYVEVYDPTGAVAGRAGALAAPLHFRRTLPATPAVVAPPAWYTHWYVWTVVGVVAAGAAGTGIYFATRPRDVSLTFGGAK